MSSNRISAIIHTRDAFLNYEKGSCAKTTFMSHAHYHLQYHHQVPCGDGRGCTQSGTSCLYSSQSFPILLSPAPVPFHLLQFPINFLRSTCSTFSTPSCHSSFHYRFGCSYSAHATSKVHEPLVGHRSYSWFTSINSSNPGFYKLLLLFLP